MQGQVQKQGRVHISSGLHEIGRGKLGQYSQQIASCLAANQIERVAKAPDPNENPRYACRDMKKLHEMTQEGLTWQGEAATSSI
jgi:hypothetical protein